MKPLRYLFGALAGAMTLLLSTSSALASESDLILPDLASVKFHGTPGSTLLTYGLIVCVLGLVFLCEVEPGSQDLENAPVVLPHGNCGAERSKEHRPGNTDPVRPF